MRIVLLSGEYPPQPGGVGDYTQQLGQRLAEHGERVWVCTIHDRQFVAHDLSTGNCQFFAQPVAWNWASWPVIIAALDTLRPDVLHIQYQTGAYAMHPAINLLPWRLRSLPQRPKLVVTAHDLLEPYLFAKAGPLRRLVTKRLLHDADVAIVTNPEDQQRARTLGCEAQHIPIGSNIVRVPVDLAERLARRSRIGVDAATTLVAYFGLLGTSKGVDTLVEALAMLPASFHLVVIGGAATAPGDRAYAEAVRQRIAALGLSEQVTITGQVAAEDVSRWLNAADIAALPFSDGASFRRGSLLAALAHGLPVVTTVAGNRRLDNQRHTPPVAPTQLRDGAALLVPAGNALALAAALARLAANPALQTQFGQAGLALATQFGWDTIVAQHQALYR